MRPLHEVPETIDQLLAGRVTIVQPGEGYRVSIDAILLAAAVQPASGESVLDVGCGDGGATLCLAWRAPDISLHGIDVRADAVARFRAGISRNGWDRRMTSALHDVANRENSELAACFDWVMSNPPYLPAARMDQRDQSEGHDPTSTETVPLTDWVAFMAACLHDDGRLALVHRADRLPEILGAVFPHAGNICVFPLWPRQGVPARRVIVTAQKGAKGPAKVLPGLVLHETDGSFTPAAKAVLEDGAELCVE